MFRNIKKIRSALISVYHKDKLSDVVRLLSDSGVSIYSTGGTFEFLKENGFEAKAVEELTGYPSILGGRVKTLHPKIFGGILARRDNEDDIRQLEQYEIPPFDLIIIDLYPFEETVASKAGHDEIIEKIDIGGISLIRAAAKNFKDVLIVSSRKQYGELQSLLENKEGETDIDDRRRFAEKAFQNTMLYDASIFKYFNETAHSTDVQVIEEMSSSPAHELRYGENPHQKGVFFGNLYEIFTQLHGKEISYNNLLDIDAALRLINDFDEATFAVIKHNNACGCASDADTVEAWRKALAGDPVSAFGGIIVTNREIDKACADEINKIFFEVILAPQYSEEALQILKSKKNRIILETKKCETAVRQYRSLLNGLLVQDADSLTETAKHLKTVTQKSPTEKEVADLLFANKIVKHSKSNAIVLAKDGQLLASGVGQTSRVDALKQAIEKAKNFGFSLSGAVMASDAFFPFSDCVEIAFGEGITAVVQPGGSQRDNESIDYCNKVGMTMIFTGFRHFKH
ncbi:MAG: bifunctional phosphoribosylaminoimidazolecarboxamide formyltransferase/IMP cyclohydrolase [Prevotellaceae bacterium]|jgi:phosphoribosylaminoimidazolecarboxamide formyltransferase/IMP cyclohydrolase|nr:bifunctional phosphoribosylaminoimidazolecarboxamide formyltransferase/IMP cyclohydrolase [Prevotellaceae bacterium]